MIEGPAVVLVFYLACKAAVQATKGALCMSSQRSWFHEAGRSEILE